MKRSATLRLLAAAFAGGLLLTMPGHAADTSSADVSARPHTGHILRALARGLDLTAGQQAAIKNLLREHQPVLRPLVDELRTGRAALTDLVASDPLNETALAAQADRLADVNRELIVASVHLRADLRKVLTPDQLARLEGWRAQASARAESGRAMLRDWLLAP